VLASASPRRRQLLAQLGLTNIDVCPSRFAEDLPHDLGALNYVLETARAKATEVYRREINNTQLGEPAIIIAADTIIVSHTGRILEKPRGEADHINMLKMLRDQKEHKVMTAIAVMRPLESAMMPGYRMETHVEETKVEFDANGMPQAATWRMASLIARSHRRTHPCLRAHTRRQRQSGRLRHSDRRLHSHRAHRGLLRQCRGAAVARDTAAHRQGHGARGGPRR
jgi:predicted house-cleaning NTP pyrophosphatase (Maf/HAM1 superfamily)